jgi:hypothetical protein
MSERQVFRHRENQLQRRTMELEQTIAHQNKTIMALSPVPGERQTFWYPCTYLNLFAFFRLDKVLLMYCYEVFSHSRQSFLMKLSFLIIFFNIL